MGFTQQEISRIREQSYRMEQEGGMTPEALQYIYDKKLFHLFVADDLEGNDTASGSDPNFSGMRPH
ncbi:hypothetical protein VQ056_13060 [Paenibacillus sp. JTLBN-2024]